jgi:hypothetical protein
MGKKRITLKAAIKAGNLAFGSSWHAGSSNKIAPAFMARDYFSAAALRPAA